MEDISTFYPKILELRDIAAKRAMQLCQLRVEPRTQLSVWSVEFGDDMIVVTLTDGNER